MKRVRVDDLGARDNDDKGTQSMYPPAHGYQRVVARKKRTRDDTVFQLLDLEATVSDEEGEDEDEDDGEDGTSPKSNLKSYYLHLTR